MQHRNGPQRSVGRVLLVALLATIVAGCATFERVGFAWNLVRAMRAGGRFRKNHEANLLDVPFSDRSDVTLDVYAPESGDGYPVLIFIHGGGWDKYDKELFAPVAMQLVPRDIVVVIPDYTLYPDADYRQMAGEVADAVAWTFEHIEEFGGDSERVTLSGHSAGGHLSGLVAFDARWLSRVGYDPADLRGWIGMSGVYDVDAQMAFERSTGGDAPVMTAVMDGEENFPAASPIRYISRASGDNQVAGNDAVAVGGGRGAAGSRGIGFEVTLIHGAEDETVPVSIAESFVDRLAEAGVDAKTIIYDEGDHVDFLFRGLSDPDAPVLIEIAEAVSGTAVEAE